MELAQRLFAYMDSVRKRDPSVRNRWEIIFYPGVLALGLHRLAHWLFEGQMFFLARFVNHVGRWLTAIDIHPGAKIGRHLFIDHGFVVIGETAEIGDNVTIYPSATLGGTNPANGIGGKRHPTIGDDVIIGSGAQILGPIVVGNRARIGANAVVTKDVPEAAVMVGIPARATLLDAEEFARFTPYGTPCRDIPDPTAKKLAALQAEIDDLRRIISSESSGESSNAPGVDNVDTIGAESPAEVESDFSAPASRRHSR